MKKLKLSKSIHAWAIWCLSALFMFYKYGLEVSPSVMTNTLMGSFQITGVDLGNLAAAYFYAYLLLQIPAGLLLDKFGPRKMTTMAIGICALGSLIFANADTLAMAEIGRFFVGAGAAFAAVNCLKLTANWFPSTQFAFMAGLMMTIAMLGAVGGQAPLAHVISLFEWRFAMKYIGYVGLVFAFIFALVVRDKSPHVKAEKQLTSSKTSLWETLKKVLQSSQSWWLSVYSGLAFAPVMVFGGLWGVTFLSQAYDLPESFAAQQASLIFIGFAIGAPIFGHISDRLQRRKIVMFWGSLVSLFSICFVIYSPGFSIPFLSLALFLFGFSISTFLLCFSMIREINPPALAATALGFMNAFNALIGAFSDPMTGKVLDSRWTGLYLNEARLFTVDAYQIAFLMLPIYLILALLSLLKIKETYCKPTYPSSLP